MCCLSVYQRACSIVGKIDATVKMLPTCSKQQHRSNLPAKDAESYYRINVSVKFLDHLLAEMNSRFSTSNCKTVMGFSTIPSNIKSINAETPVLEGNKWKYDDAFMPCKENTLKSLCSDACSRNVSCHHDDQSTTANLAAGDNHTNVDDAVQIQRLDREWEKDFKTFCSLYSKDFPNKKHDFL